MPALSDEVAADFQDALQDLKVNSRPEISNLTIIAKENTEHAQAISEVLRLHIKSTSPQYKLPALYVLDSIVKNVGTPYTVYLGRSLYETFMGAFQYADNNTRRAMEGLLNTWKMPVPESMDPSPVFSAEVTRDIENALQKFRNLAIQQENLAQKYGKPQSMPARPITSTPWRNTPTPPQNGPRYFAPNDPRRQLKAHAPPQQHLGQYGSPATPSTHFQPTPSMPYQQSQPAPVTVDVQKLKEDLAGLIQTTQATWARDITNAETQTRLRALLDLKKLLDAQSFAPQVLQQIQSQIQALSPPVVPAVAPPLITAPPPFIQSPQQHVASAFPPPSVPVDLAQIMAAARPSAPSSSTPLPATNILADLLRRTSTPAQNPTPTAVPPFFPPFSAPSAPPSAPPAPAPAPQANLAQILAGMQSALPQQSTPLPVQQPVHQPVQSSTPTPDWLANVLKNLPVLPGVPPIPTGTPLSSQPMTRHMSTNTAMGNGVELTTAAMKQPRPDLIAKLYGAFPNQCVTCGRRFAATAEGKEKKMRHMDWHFKVKDPDAAKRGIHRSWYISEKDWIDYRELDDASPDQATNMPTIAAPKKEAKDRYVPVPSDSTLVNAPCPICQEKFEPQWLVDANDFVWMDAMEVGGRIYHATCYEEYKKGAGITSPSTPDSVLGKRKADDTLGSGKKVRAY